MSRYERWEGGVRIRLRVADGGLPKQILQNTRERLLNNYQQIPQLSCGGHYDLDQPLMVSLLEPRLATP